MSSLTAKRYAAALFSVASDDGNFDKYHSELQSLMRVFADSDVARFLQSDRINVADKITVIKKTLSDKPVEIVNFACLLTVKGCTTLLADIVEEFEREVAEHQNNLRVKIYTASKLNSESLTAVRAKLNNIFDVKNLDIQEEIVPEMIGGIKIQVGDIVLDGSVSSSLNAIKRNLLIHSIGKAD